MPDAVLTQSTQSDFSIRHDAEGGVFGLEQYLAVKAVLGYRSA